MGCHNLSPLYPNLEKETAVEDSQWVGSRATHEYREIKLYIWSLGASLFWEGPAGGILILLRKL